MDPRNRTLSSCLASEARSTLTEVYARMMRAKTASEQESLREDALVLQTLQADTTPRQSLPVPGVDGCPHWARYVTWSKVGVCLVFHDLPRLDPVSSRWTFPHPNNPADLWVPLPAWNHAHRAGQKLRLDHLKLCYEFICSNPPRNGSTTLRHCHEAYHGLPECVCACGLPWSAHPEYVRKREAAEMMQQPPTGDSRSERVTIPRHMDARLQLFPGMREALQSRRHVAGSLVEVACCAALGHPMGRPAPQDAHEREDLRRFIKEVPSVREAYEGLCKRSPLWMGLDLDSPADRPVRTSSTGDDDGRHENGTDGRWIDEQQPAGIGPRHARGSVLRAREASEGDVSDLRVPVDADGGAQGGVPRPRAQADDPAGHGGEPGGHPQLRGGADVSGDGFDVRGEGAAPEQARGVASKVLTAHLLESGEAFDCSEEGFRALCARHVKTCRRVERLLRRLGKAVEEIGRLRREKKALRNQLRERTIMHTALRRRFLNLRETNGQANLALTVATNSLEAAQAEITRLNNEITRLNAQSPFDKALEQTRGKVR